ncbi:putative protein kinase domain, leucine-rich repeat domain superfamily [Plasmopara halstedii]
MTATLCLQCLSVLVLTLIGILNIANGDCAMGYSTLTTEGCLGCSDFDLCFGLANKKRCTDSGCKIDGDCSYQCMAVAKRNTLEVTIGFGKYESMQEIGTGDFTTADLGDCPNRTDTRSSVSSDDVKAVAKISVSKSIETFTMSGGIISYNYPRGKVVSMTIVSNFISSATAVTRVVLKNLGLENQVDNLSSLLPSTVKRLELTNTLLSKFPTKLGRQLALRELILDFNYITTVVQTDVVDSITTLSLAGNSIKTFTGVFTNLETLSLSGNVLTTFPDAIYEHLNLNTLDLTGNSFTVREFTSDQAAFLSNLEKLYLSASDFTVELECDENDQVTIHDVTVCVRPTDPSADKADTAMKSKSGIETSPTSTGSDATFFSISDSSPTSSGLLVGIICGVSVVLFGIFLFVFYRQRQKDLPQSKLDDPLGFTGTFPSVDGGLGLQQSYDGLQSSSAMNVDIPMESNELSIDDLTARDDESHCMNERAFVDTNVGVSFFYEKTSSTSSSELTVKTDETNFDEYTSIWDDPDLLSLQVRAATVTDIKLLGSGAFAMVWLVQYRNSQMIASKRLRPEMQTKTHIATFIEEIKLIANFSHPNLVKFVGAAWTMESDLQMLLEYMDGGDLRTLLAESQTSVDWNMKKADIAIEVIEAIAYLHSFEPPVVHRDLNSANVLLSSELKAKLSNFVTSRFRPVSNRTSSCRWLAPEVIRGDTDFGKAADIYSFGALLTELYTNEIPLNNVHEVNDSTLSDTNILHHAANGQEYPETGFSLSPALKELVERCLAQDQTKRPTATTLALELRLIQKDMTIRATSRSTNLRISELT